jgi:hemolysin III
MKEKPLLRGHFHQAMFFVALGACLPLIFKSEGQLERWAALIYSGGVLAMFGISSLYHRVTWSPERRALWKKLDHAAIYLMIAGTFTPVALLGLEPAAGKTLLLTIWAVAMVGVIQSIFFVNLPKMVSAAIYLVAGYLIVPYMGELYHSLGIINLWLIIAGGIAYSVGALSYGLKRPVLNPKIFSYHEVFHLFVNLGAILHFIVIYSLIR